MAWIKVRTNLDTDPRVIAIASDLATTELHVVGMLWKLWSWADSHSVDGNAMSVTDVTLDRFVSVTGFAKSLRKIGWLTGESGSLTFTNFSEHNGITAKKRAETARRVTKHRNASVTQKALPDKTRQDKTRQFPVPSLQSPEAIPEKLLSLIPDEWLTTTAEPIRFADADGSEASIFAKISREETIKNPRAVLDWWRYQLGCRDPATGPEVVWCLLCLALGLKFSNPKKKWSSRIGVWSSAIGRRYWSQAEPYIPRAIELLGPIVFPVEAPNGDK